MAAGKTSTGRSPGGDVRRAHRRGDPRRDPHLPRPDPARTAPLARPLGPRVTALNRRIREAARRRGVTVAEAAHHPVVTDSRLWSPDRLHAGPLGHQRIAAALAHAPGLPGADDSWTHPLPPPGGRPQLLPLLDAA
ncbi:hypothetical protein AB0A70_23540 [Streptomyces morookaense]